MQMNTGKCRVVQAMVSNVDVRKATQICRRSAFLVVLVLAQCGILADKVIHVLDTKD